MNTSRKSTLSYFYVPIIFTIIGFAYAFMHGGAIALYQTAILAILEICVSFDNAVVNAKEVKKLSPFWRKIFLTVGIIIAVFAMRILFPIVIVSFVSGLSILETFALGVENPAKYSEYLEQSAVAVSGFGGAFLFMVFFVFFFDSEKDVHWIPAIEKRLAKAGLIRSSEVLLTLAMSGIMWHFISDKAQAAAFMVASAFGVITFLAVEFIRHLLAPEEEAEDVTKKDTFKHLTGTAALGLVMYLEVLDASFSFDGVIGAFAITKDIFIVGIGLGIGAFYVRSFTMYMVDRDILDAFRYLEHGAFWAIGGLASIMYLHVMVHIPELITGGLSLGLIGISIYSSVKWKNENKMLATQAGIPDEVV